MGAQYIAAHKAQGKITEVKHLLLSVIVCFIVFMPWQVYIHLKYPVEAAYETAYNTRHIFEAVEGHGGTASYYFDNLDSYFGNNLWPLLILGFIVLKFRRADKKIEQALTTCFLLVLCFFSFIVKTKMPGYIFIIAPIGFIYIAAGAQQLISYLPGALHKWVLAFACMWFGIIIFDLERMALTFDPMDDRRIVKAVNTQTYKALHSKLPSNIKYILNANGYENIEVMFYNNDVNVYSFCLTQEEFDLVTKDKIPIAAFKDRYGYSLPRHVSDYPYLYIIQDDVYRYQ